jgi:hypothetical protein
LSREEKRRVQPSSTPPMRPPRMPNTTWDRVGKGGDDVVLCVCAAGVGHSR